jgi:hypothetical protein
MLKATALSIALLITLAAVPASAQAPVQFNVTSTFTADVIVNTDPDPPTPFDEDNDPIDDPGPGGNFALLTQAAAVAACPTPVGLPDNGFFAANASHPDVQLAYNDANSGNNARRSPSFSTDSYSFSVPANNYTNVHLFFTAGNGSATANVTLTYATGAPTTTPITVPDWFNNPPPPTYALFDGGDRIPPDAPFICEDSNTTAIFGVNIGGDPVRVLQSVGIVRTDLGSAVMSFFGGTGVLLVPVELQAFTVE